MRSIVIFDLINQREADREIITNVKAFVDNFIDKVLLKSVFILDNNKSEDILDSLTSHDNDKIISFINDSKEDSYVVIVLFEKNNYNGAKRFMRIVKYQYKLQEEK